ncbi:MAG: hypothetical protein Q9202_007516 [Teloschistes flavicans]
MNNGAGDMMRDIRNNGPHLLPYTDGAPLKKMYTGIAAVDYQLTVLILFFYNVVDGSHPGACLQAYHFVGQTFAGYGLLVLESLRYGNESKIISFITIWGFAFQNADFAVIIPLFCAAHLATSPTISFRKQRDFLLDQMKLTSLPYSMAIGLLLPTIAAALHAPSVVSHERKQTLMAIWQAFPIWVGVSQWSIASVRSLLGNKSSTGKPQISTVKSMRTIYAILLTFAVVTRISTWAVSISATLFPSLFAPDIVSSLTPSAVFKPLSASPSVKVPSIAAGSLQLLQYDEMVGAAAMVVWSTALYLSASGRKEPGEWMSLIAKGVAIEALAGPQGFAVVAIWARDEKILAKENDEKKDS